MTVRFLLGWLLLIVATGPLVLAAVRARARLVPSWRGLPARLADITLVLALLLAVLHILGTVGLFRVAPVVIGCAMVGTVLAVALGRMAQPAPAGPAVELVPSPPTWAVVGSLAMVAILIAVWVARIGPGWHLGFHDVDSNWYHLPHAARFVQDGLITPLHYTRPEYPSMFNPGDGELFHALGMLLFRSDLLSFVINFGWLGLTLAAAWCVGRPLGMGPLTMAATAVVLLTPEITGIQPGAAVNDVATFAMLLLVAAFLVIEVDHRGALVLAGLAAGVGLGMKLTLLAPIGALTVGIVVLARRGQRRSDGLAWTIPLLASGGFWFVRNLIRAGSPVPSVKLPAIASPVFTGVDTQGLSIAHYATDGNIWRHYFLPGLHDAMGPLWWAIVALSAVGIIGALVRGNVVQRLLAIAALASIITYVVMPTGATGPPGQPVLFIVNIRYGFPGLILGLVLLVTLPEIRRPPVATVAAGVLALLFIVLLAFNHGPLASWDALSKTYGFVALLGAVVVAAAGWLLKTRPGSRRLLAAATAGVLAVVTVGSAVAQHRYARDRYPLQAWARGLDARIGVVGTNYLYPFYGTHFENYVQYVGQPGSRGEFHTITSCPAWRDALRTGRYRYLVVLPVEAGEYVRQRAWTLADPAAKLVIDQPGQQVFQLAGTSNPAGCP